MSARILVVYFTRTGHTKTIAEAIAKAVGADLEEITDRTRRSGLLGYLRSSLEAALHRRVEIGPAEHDPADYEIVVVGTPIWDMAVSSPVRSYLRRYRDAFRSLAFFCTCGGMGGERAFAQMERAGGAKPAATLILREADLEHPGPAIERFVTAVSRAIELAAAPSAPLPAPTRLPLPADRPIDRGGR